MRANLVSTTQPPLAISHPHRRVHPRVARSLAALVRHHPAPPLRPVCSTSPVRRPVCVCSGPIQTYVDRWGRFHHRRLHPSTSTTEYSPKVVNQWIICSFLFQIWFEAQIWKENQLVPPSWCTDLGSFFCCLSNILKQSAIGNSLFPLKYLETICYCKFIHLACMCGLIFLLLWAT